MHILIISHMYPSKIRPVLGIFVQQQARAMSALGHKVTVICPTPWIPKWISDLPQRWKEFQNLPKEEQDGAINVYFPRGLVVPKSLDRWRGRLYYWSLKQFVSHLFKENDFDLIHAHTILTSGDLGQILKSKYNLPLVITIHGGDILRKARESLKNRRRILYVLSQAEVIGVVSGKLKKNVLTLSNAVITLPEIKIIHNGIKIEDPLSSIEWKKNDKYIKLLSIGSLSRQKNYSLVFKALAQLKDEFPLLRYDIIGEGWDREYYENEIYLFGLDKIVHLRGAMPHNLVMVYLKEADIFILPSINEGFGIVYLEAMYFGKITIGSKGEPIEEIIRHGENGFLFKPWDAGELAGLLTDIINHKYNLGAISSRAKETVWPRFSWENNAREYEKNYLNCLNKERSNY